MADQSPINLGPGLFSGCGLEAADFVDDGEAAKSFNGEAEESGEGEAADSDEPVQRRRQGVTEPGGGGLGGCGGEAAHRGSSTERQRAIQVRNHLAKRVAVRSL